MILNIKPLEFYVLIVIQTVIFLYQNINNTIPTVAMISAMLVSYRIHREQEMKITDDYQMSRRRY
jgi:hypothetical protein